MRLCTHFVACVLDEFRSVWYTRIGVCAVPLGVLISVKGVHAAVVVCPRDCRIRGLRRRRHRRPRQTAAGIVGAGLGEIGRGRAWHEKRVVCRIAVTVAVAFSTNWLR